MKFLLRYIVGADGNIAYKGGLGPDDYKLEEVAEWLQNKFTYLNCTSKQQQQQESQRQSKPLPQIIATRNQEDLLEKNVDYVHNCKQTLTNGNAADANDAVDANNAVDVNNVAVRL